MRFKVIEAALLGVAIGFLAVNAGIANHPGVMARHGSEAAADKPHLLNTFPASGAHDAAVDQGIALSFSSAMDPASLTSSTVTLIGPQGPVNVALALGDNGRKVTAMPTQQLLPDSFYSLYVNGARAANGAPMPMAAMSFQTARLSSGENAHAAVSDTAYLQRLIAGGTYAKANDSADANPDQLSARKTSYIADGRWYPGQSNGDGRWRVNQPRPELPEFTALHRSLPPGATAVFGQILQIDDQPIADVEVAIGSRVTRTDAQGLFLLTDLTPGRQELFVDGTHVGLHNFEYSQLVVGVDVQSGQVNSLPQQIYLPKIGARDRIHIESPTTREVVITHPELPGLEIHIPAGTVIRDYRGHIVTELALVPTPVDRAPYPVPVNFPVYFTLQPGGATILGLTPEAAKGVRVVYPNYTHAQADSTMDFWFYDPKEGWKIYGKGRVSADARHVLPDGNVTLYAATGTSIEINNNPPPPPNGAPGGGGGGGGGGPGGGGGGGGGGGAGGGGGGGGGGGDGGSGGPGGGGPGGCCDPVDLRTGLYSYDHTDFAIADITPLILTRSYRPNDPVSRAFGYGMNFNYGIYLYHPSTDTAYNTPEVILPDGTAIVFTRVSGSGPNGTWKHTGSASAYYGAVMTSGPGNGYPTNYIYTVTFTDGSQYVFNGGEGYLNAQNVLLAMIDRFGNTLSLSYDSNARLSKASAQDGRYLHFDWDSNNRIKTVTDHTGRSVGYTYYPAGAFGAGSLETVTYNTDGTFQVYGYDSSNRMTTIQDRNGNVVVTNDYDANGRVWHQTLIDGTKYTFTYTVDGSGTVTETQVKTVDPVDNLTIVRDVVFDSTGYPKTDIYGYGQADAQTWSYTRDPSSGLILTETDPLQRTTQYTYDGNGNVLTKTYMYGTSEAVTYTYTYTTDGYNQLQTVQDPLLHTTTYGYTNGCLTSIQDPMLNTWTRTCYGTGQIKTMSEPAPLNQNTTTYSYQGYDLSSITNGLGAGHTTTFYRDELGRITSIVDPLGNTTVTTYDGNDRVQTVTDPMGGLTQYHYDNNGNLKQVTDPNGGYIQYGYDLRNRMNSRTDALLLHSESWSYDGFGNWVTYKDRNGQTTTQTPDDLGRVHIVTYADTSTLTYGYDAANRLRTVVDSLSGTITLTPDDLNRPQTALTPQGTVNYTYDNASFRRTMKITGQTNGFVYTPDNDNRLSQITLGSETVGIGYDNASRRQTLTLPNGMQTGYGFDAADELTGLTYTNKSGTTLGTLVYGYDAAGRRISQTGTWAYNQLPTATTSDYQVDAGDRLNAGNGYSPVYDNQGQMLQDGKGNTYTWNARHQLTQINQGTTAKFYYDGLGRRYQKTIGTTTTTYLYDGVTPIQEKQGSTVNNLLTGWGADEIYARTDTPGRMYYLSDALGSTIALTAATGIGQAIVKQQYAYDPYGNATKLKTATVTNPYTYTGREDDGTGLYYYRARYYNPTLSRFIAEDPIGLAGGPNIYAYVGGSPTNFTDPSGLLGHGAGHGPPGAYTPARDVPGAVIGPLIVASTAPIAAVIVGANAPEIGLAAAIALGFNGITDTMEVTEATSAVMADAAEINEAGVVTVEAVPEATEEGMTLEEQAEELQEMRDEDFLENGPEVVPGLPAIIPGCSSCY